MKYNSSKLTDLQQVNWSIWTFIYISNVQMKTLLMT